MSNETELIRSLQLQVEELKAKLADVQTAPKRSKVRYFICFENKTKKLGAFNFKSFLVTMCQVMRIRLILIFNFRLDLRFNLK